MTQILIGAESQHCEASPGRENRKMLPLFAYLLRFAQSDPEHSTLACEFSQMIPLYTMPSRRSGMPLGMRPGHKLNFFCVAQKIRNERGAREST